MGSTLAGVKAGVLTGLLYGGAVAMFNLLALYVAKSDILAYISNNFAQLCSPVTAINSTTIEDCYSYLAPFYVPALAFGAFLVSLVYAGVFGRLYEYIPGKNPSFKGLIFSPVVAINMILFGLAGVTFRASVPAGLVALLSTTLAYGFLLGRFYKRYTRIVRFESEDESSLRIMVDRSDFTGKTRTFAHRSSHKVKASEADGSSFKGWTVSGGVIVEDSKSFETSMEVNGDGLLKALVSKKYLAV